MLYDPGVERMDGLKRQRRVRRAALSALCAGVVGVMVGGGALALSAGASAPDPPGNNGTVKVDDQPIDSIPNNNPHVGCVFHVDFYGFDEGVGDATVTFTMQAPTKDVGLAVAGDTSPDIGEDPAGGGNDLDASETYTLTFDGDPHPQQGFHVKLTVNAPGSIGADAKHKVFWVQGCETPTTPPTETTPTSPPTETTPPTSPPTETTPPTSPPTETTPPTSPPTETTPPTGTPPGQPPSTQPPPTEVVAGLTGGSDDDSGGPGSWWPVGLISAGALMAGGAALALRRRGDHQA
jgi:hypothetical protein